MFSLTAKKLSFVSYFRTHSKIYQNEQKMLNHCFCCSETWLMFSGGMPRATYGDKFTVTVIKGEDQVLIGYFLS